MNRREFVKATGFTSALLACGAVYDTASGRGLAPPPSDSEMSALVERSIKADFGAGFRLRSYVRQERKFVAAVEHLQNRYVIESADLTGWSIVSSSVS